MAANFEIQSPSTPLGVRATLSGAISFLRNEGLEEDQVGTAEIVLAEVLNNIAEHAHQETGSGHIDLSLSVDG